MDKVHLSRLLHMAMEDMQKIEAIPPDQANADTEFERGMLYGFVKALSYVLQQPEQPLKSNTIGTKRKPRTND